MILMRMFDVKFKLIMSGCTTFSKNIFWDVCFLKRLFIEQGEIYSMQCSESHGKGVRKSAPKKAKYHAGVAVKNHIAVLHQANCTYSEIYKILKAEEIPISLLAI